MAEILADRGRRYLIFLATAWGLIAVALPMAVGRPGRAVAPLFWGAVLLALAFRGRRWAARLMAIVIGFVVVAFGAGGAYGARPSLLLASCFLAIALGGLYVVHRFWTSSAVDAYFLRKNGTASPEAGWPPA